MVLKQQSKVIFAEAGKDFVDVLFSFLTLPLGTIASLVRKESKLQPPEVALSSIYQSVENLPRECLRTDTCEEMLLLPRNSMEDFCSSLKINIDDNEPTHYFVCNHFQCGYKAPVLISTFKNKSCECGSMLEKPISLETSDVFDGFIKSNHSFMITDDLKVFPNSLDKVVNVLKDSGIRNTSSLSEMTVNITEIQVVDLFKFCFCSKTVLTDLFLRELPRDISHESGRITYWKHKANSCDEIVVKVVLRKSKGKILLAEGKEDFADLIFSLLTIPLGGALQLMGGCSYVGSVDGLYKSVVDLDEHYFTTKEVKNKFVDPLLAPQYKLSNLLPLSCDNFPNYFCYLISNGLGFETCCLTSMYKEDESFSGCVSSKFVDPLSDPSKNGERYIKGPTTYIATDDLVVTPSSSISVMSLLISMNIPVADLLEKEVRIGMVEAVLILQASLTSTSALTLGLSHLLTKVKEN
ncbi:hypothetical protein PHAVU_008G110000 [Phaseolus vulgaris]|uniref:DUF674 family protein n=1 Tax=Phaseolus vulgaris TaxID=3885 RepID=V7B4A3_PHAVU|nr:hypothetical protein PHAVU_008G110000g [Phaseolus vulgaris]ESW12410.1 hypothetical protein PHAVU_008G110000g [Phaseolus vulgaris]